MSDMLKLLQQKVKEAHDSYNESLLSYSMCVEEKKKQLDAIEEKYAKKQGDLKDKTEENLLYKHNMVASLVDNMPRWYLDEFVFSTVMDCLLQEEENLLFYHEETSVSSAVKRSFANVFSSFYVETKFFSWVIKSGKSYCVIPTIKPIQGDKSKLSLLAGNLDDYVSAVQKMLEEKGLTQEVFIPIDGDGAYNLKYGVYDIYSPYPGKYKLGMRYQPHEYYCNNPISFNSNTDIYKQLFEVLEKLCSGKAVG